MVYNDYNNLFNSFMLSDAKRSVKHFVFKCLLLLHGFFEFFFVKSQDIKYVKLVLLISLHMIFLAQTRGTIFKIKVISFNLLERIISPHVHDRSDKSCLYYKLSVFFLTYRCNFLLRKAGGILAP